VVRIVFNYLPKISAELQPAAIKIVSRSAANIESMAKEIVPVRTGTLRRSIHQEPRGDALRKTIGPDTPYDAFVEYGTRYMAARPYMTPSAEHERRPFEQAIRELLRGLP
jgi:HK97 gp10 family phage protein